MGRKKRYVTEAQKQAAYRARRNNLPVPVVAEPQETQSKASDTASGEARETTNMQPTSLVRKGQSPESRGGQSFPERPKGFDKAMWEYACERAQRARQYAKAMPEHVKPSEVCFQSPEWQYADQARYPLPSGKMLD